MGELYVGLISGTSMDAVDACIVDCSASPPRLIATLSYPVPAAIKSTLSTLTTETARDALDTLGRVDVRIGELFADATTALLNQAGYRAEDIRAIGSHGQTVRHGMAAEPPYTLQTGDPNVIAQRTGIDVIADFRRRDVALGGQGAPLAPAFHAATLRSPGETRVILNLGGIANVTVLPRDDADVTGWDTGPANCLLDAWNRKHGRGEYDADGRWAGQGKRIPGLLDAMLADPYFARAAPKSTGTETFNLGWLQQFRPDDHSAEDVQATLVALTAQTAASGVGAADRVLVCGGGRHNAALMEHLREGLSPTPVESTDDHGVPGDWVEAMTFAWLADRWFKRQPGNLPAVTGARDAAVLGGCYPVA